MRILECVVCSNGPSEAVLYIFESPNTIESTSNFASIARL